MAPMRRREGTMEGGGERQQLASLKEREEGECHNGGGVRHFFKEQETKRTACR